MEKEKEKKKKFPFKPKIDGTIYHPIAFLVDKDITADGIEYMTKIALALSQKGFTIRVSSGSCGDAIRKVVPKTQLEQFAPWEGFDDSEDVFGGATNHAKAIAMRFQPGLNVSKQVFWSITGHQVNLVLGKDTRSPATIVVCWTPCGSESAKDPGLARFSTVKMGLLISNYIEAPVYNLSREDGLARLKEDSVRYYKDFEEGEWSRSLFDYIPPKK